MYNHVVYLTIHINRCINMFTEVCLLASFIYLVVFGMPLTFLPVQKWKKINMQLTYISLDAWDMMICIWPIYYYLHLIHEHAELEENSVIVKATQLVSGVAGLWTEFCLNLKSSYTTVIVTVILSLFPFLELTICSAHIRTEPVPPWFLPPLTCPQISYIETSKWSPCW